MPECIDAKTGRRVEWKIEASDRPKTSRGSDADAARRFRAVFCWFPPESLPEPLRTKVINVSEIADL